MMLIGQIVMLCVVLTLLLPLTEGKRAHRIGVTILACWSIVGLCVQLLNWVHQPLPEYLTRDWYWPAGLFIGSWALWDLSRLTRQYGTTTLLDAAEIARGFILSPRVSHHIWHNWAEHLPSAAWLKGPRGIMLAINRQYEKKYGAVAREYAGETDGAQWGPDIAAEFDGNDRTVFEVGEPIIVRETAPLPGNADRVALFLKFPVRDRRGTVVGVGGVELLQATTDNEIGTKT